MNQTSFPLLHDPEELVRKDDWWCKLPFVGGFIQLQRQYENEWRLVKQVLDRGPVPESEWEPYEYDRAVRNKIEQIVNEEAYFEGTTFHPLDPVELMMVLRYGDLNEVAILMAIEKAFGVSLGGGKAVELIERKTTFIEFIHWVSENRQTPPT